VLIFQTPFVKDVDDKTPSWASKKAAFDSFLRSIKELKAAGGDDIAEDVLGALEKAATLEW
jgi:hypothetical protein